MHFLAPVPTPEVLKISPQTWEKLTYQKSISNHLDPAYPGNPSNTDYLQTRIPTSKNQAFWPLSQLVELIPVSGDRFWYQT